MVGVVKPGGFWFSAWCIVIIIGLWLWDNKWTILGTTAFWGGAYLLAR
jgi:hypothetical protein